MRLNAGGVRELHWHTAAEWAIMLYGSARITLMEAGLSVDVAVGVSVNLSCFHCTSPSSP
jgi:oxalate decarboxylase/phosphoglucose isomerase-like protein (cupin superfamily)